MSREQIAQEALSNARNSASVANYAAIFAGFAAKGIPEEDIKPRENVLTFWAWQAVGRKVKKGEHGVRVSTWIPMTKKDKATGEHIDIGRKPKSTTVFHVSQTEPIQGFDAPRALTNCSPSFALKPESSSYYSDEFTPL